MKPRLIVWIVTVALQCGFVEAAEWQVKPDGSGDVPTIQDAVDASEDGDTIVLWPGEHQDEDQVIPVVEKSLTFRSEGAAGSATILNAVLAFANCESVVVDGIDFKADEFEAAGLRAEFCGDVHYRRIAYHGFRRPTYAVNCVLVRAEESKFFDNTIVEDTYFAEGAGFFVSGALTQLVTVSGCEFRNNNARINGGGLVVSHVEQVVVTGNLFVGNMSGAGSAAYFDGTSVEFSSNTVVDNGYDGSIYLGGAVVLNNPRASSVHHNGFAFNTTYGLKLDEHGIPATFYCNAFHGNPSAPGPFSHGEWYGAPDTPESDWDIIFGDPQFCDVDGGDYHLMSSSPLLPANFPPDAETCSMTVGAFDGNGCVNPVLPTTWGRLKDRFGKQSRSGATAR